jgi:hypothetical protein
LSVLYYVIMDRNGYGVMMEEEEGEEEGKE